MGKDDFVSAQKQDSRPEISQSDLNDALLALKDFVAAFDFKNADNVIAMLEEYSMPLDFVEKYNKIKHSLKAVDHDALMELLA